MIVPSADESLNGAHASASAAWPETLGFRAALRAMRLTETLRVWRSSLHPRQHLLQLGKEALPAHLGALIERLLIRPEA
jgi:hypothetical protein